MYRHLLLVIAFACGVAIYSGASKSQDAKLMVFVSPGHADIFVDGKPIGNGSMLIHLPSGTHNVAAYNYGYAPQFREVSLKAGKNPTVEFKLKRTGAKVMGPHGRIQIEGAPRAAVFLNGKSPGYFVGHGDEFNNNFLTWQQLIVPPGTYEVTVVDKDKELWSGPVTVQANRRVIVDVAKAGRQKVKKWPEGQDAKSFPRSRNGILGDTVVAVAPVSGEFKADQTKVNCGESTRLAWSSAETVEAQINDGSEQAKYLSSSGELWARPRNTTTYQFQATGPGGTVKSESIVEVNTAVQASLEASPAEVHYRQIGDKVVQQGSSTLNWSTFNSDSITLEAVGLVTATGNQALQPAPKQTSEGTVNETVEYTLVAKNQCGGSETRTATIHLTGSIEPIPKVPLASVFFPTGYPSQRHPEVGLVPSQELALSEAASGFKAYLEYDPDARLQIIGHADARDSQSQNQALSERRGAAVRQYLIAAGVPSDKIDITANGEQDQLNVTTIKSLEKENPNKAQVQNLKAIVWAYNRRVDLLMIPKGAGPVSSVRFFPNNAPEASLLRSSVWQSPGAVEKAGGNGAMQTASSVGR